VRRYVAFLGLCFELGCGSPLPEPPGGASAAGSELGVRLSTEPQAELDAAPAVLRLRAELAGSAVLEPGDVQVYHGELSAYHLGRVERADLPSTLVERRVPTVSWVAQDPPALVIAPAVALAPGERYSVISVVRGLLGVITVREQPSMPLLSRIWPPLDQGCGAEHVVYCGSGISLLEPVSVRLDPGGLGARLVPGVDRDATLQSRCTHLQLLEAAAEGSVYLPPPAVAQVALDPAPLRTTACDRPARMPCEAGSIQLSVGCARVQDDRLVILGPPAPTFWIVGTDPPTVQALPASGRLVVRGLLPDSEQPLEVSVVDLAGRIETSTQWVSTTAPRAHVVINELLANAVGPEPDREWVELYNDGAVATELEGWTLEDNGGVAVLPRHLLGPGAYALVVNEGFAADAEVDIAPAPGTSVLEVPKLGKQGLSNAGELLRLRAPDGSVLSRFPPIAQRQGGTSAARVHPWCADDDPDSFGLHAAPGASPGAPNRLP
jgi:hypothetical protein